MKLHGNLQIGGKSYKKGDTVPVLFIYPFFLFHMAMFGMAGFFMAYGAKNVSVFFLYMHGGIAILVYTVFYFTIFGRDEVKWMFINAGLSVFAIYSQIDWLLFLFGKRVSDFPWYIHVIPFMYMVLYTFLIRQAVIDLTASRDNLQRRKLVESIYVIVSVVVYSFIAFA